MIGLKKRFIVLSLMLLLPLGVQAADLETVEQRIAEAEQARALEYSPNNYAQARALVEKAKGAIQEGNNAKAVQLLDEALLYASQAIKTSQRISEDYSSLAESRDRLQLIGDEYVRGDLGDRSEDEFKRVVAAVEENDNAKAAREAAIAAKTIQDAQVVAARKRFAQPITQAVADARRHSARKYSPEALNRALEAHKQLEELIKQNPNDSGGAYKLSVAGVKAASKSQSVGDIGEGLSKDPASVEAWVNRNQVSLQKLADIYGIKLDEDDLTETHVATLVQAAQDQKVGYLQQLEDANRQLAEMDQKLGQYDSEMANMQELRRKLQVKREAEAKIKRLTKLFDPAKVEILLTTEADVILRMKKLNFRSGSAVIPPDSYDLLDRTVEAFGTFPDRSIRIEGHTDSVGESAFNQRLSERRAKAVEAYMQERVPQGVAMKSVGFGEEKPAANNETAAGREKNRRIDIVLIAPK